MFLFSFYVLGLSETNFTCNDTTCIFTGSGVLDPNYIKNETFKVPQTLIINGDFTSIGDKSFQLMSRIELVILNSSKLTHLGSSTFKRCTSLVKVINPTKSLRVIGDYSFMGCNSLEDVDFFDYITDVGVEAFSGDVKLKPLSKVSFNVSSRAFYNCATERSVVILGHVKIGANAFYRSTMEELTVEAGEISDGAFLETRELKTLKLSSNVKKIGRSAFSYSGILNLKVPDGVYIGDYAFSNSENLSLIEFEGQTTVGKNPFFNCTKVSIFSSKSSSLKMLDKVVVKDNVAISSFNYNMENVSLPDSVNQLGSGALAYANISTLTISVSTLNVFEHSLYKANINTLSFLAEVNDNLAKELSVVSNLSKIIYCGNYSERYSHKYFNSNVVTSVSKGYEGTTFYGASINKENTDCDSSDSDSDSGNFTAANIAVIAVSGLVIIIAIISFAVYFVKKRNRPNEMYSASLLPDSNHSNYR